MKFSRAEWSAILLQAFLCLGGLSGAIPMLLQPKGSPLGMSPSLLEHAPVDTYFWPGMFLLVFMSIWPATNIYGILKHTSWAATSTTLLGVTTIGWIMYETVTIRTFSPLQPVIFIVGCVLMLVGIRMKKSNRRVLS